MAFTFEQVRDAALHLPIEERADLAELLIGTLDDEEAASIRSQWLAIAKQRLDEMKSGQTVPIPGEQVFDNLDQLLGANE